MEISAENTLEAYIYANSLFIDTKILTQGKPIVVHVSVYVPDLFNKRPHQYRHSTSHNTIVQIEWLTVHILSKPYCFYLAYCTLW